MLRKELSRSTNPVREADRQKSGTTQSSAKRKQEEEHDGPPIKGRKGAKKPEQDFERLLDEAETDMEARFSFFSLITENQKGHHHYQPSTLHACIRNGAYCFST